MSATLEKAGQFIESTQEADGSRYGSCRVCYTISIMVLTSFSKDKTAMEVEEKAIYIHRIRRRKSKPGANRLGIDRPPIEIRSVFTALRN
ncbi:hypothetical protein HID58_075521 [Brassica napus]|uniref:Uncharacterized protein n=1 Tax=Brassica napus TaxID=3708 RepID=A0ABQ7YL14_BRANA|nr:hypothetical protein HID58_075521 [Brassica napus]